MAQSEEERNLDFPPFLPFFLASSSDKARISLPQLSRLDSLFLQTPFLTPLLFLSLWIALPPSFLAMLMAQSDRAALVFQQPHTLAK